MIKIKNKINLIGSVLDIGSSNGEYLFADHYHRIYKFSLKEFIFSFSKQVYKNTEPHHRYSKAVSCSMDGYVCMPKIQSSIGNIYRIDENGISVASRVRWHRADISFSMFSKDCKYLATGGEDGRIFIYAHPSHKLSTFLPRRPDYISCIVFDSQSKIVCYASYDLTLTVYNLQKDSLICVIDTPSVVEDMIFFEKDTKIFYVCKSGETGIFNLKTNKDEHQMNLSHWPTKIMLNTDESFVYIGTREDVLYVQSLKENLVGFSIQLSSKGVTCIKGFDDFIFICFADGSIQIIDRFYKIDEFLEILNQTGFEYAKIFADEHNVLLKTLEVYRRVKNSTWKEVVKDVSKLLSLNEIEDVINITSPYFEDPMKEKEIKEYIAEKAFIQNFLGAFREHDYPKAYEIAMDHPCIKNLNEYQIMEEYFDSIYDLAQQLIVKDINSSKEKIQTFLLPFEHLPDKKPLIMTLINECDKYLLAEKYAKAKDFENYFLLVSECPFLKNTKTYKKMHFICEKMTLQIQDLISAKKYPKAQEYLYFLATIEPFKDFANRFQNYLNNIDKFIESCTKKDYLECYKILLVCPELDSSEEYLALHEEINKVFEETKVIAQKGETAKTYANLKKFLPIEYWRNKIDITMKIAYLYEIKKALKDDSLSVDWEESLIQYIKRYGMDDEICELCNKEEKLKAIMQDLGEIPKKTFQNINHIQSIITLNKS
ncbi:hypothetical protein BKH42_03975 [Helicobacter sp. 13S00482-2]|uniref:WD40 repeat domain-containing protein n=1 Tax=Helicobacter sp. 13S00482-2 TaxID=1476200 RepID=UPI000BA51B6D|nr:WD40 repeat domain-containing protein [Helicobacter sp. 13S00482-2]PAF53899.1 hypothetical protein BKH42_03975 [Helicobacter sp. 13S00482-2]